MAEQNKRKSYPTDLTDAEWQQIEPYLPKRKSPRGRQPVHPYREILNAIFYVLRSGCAWRMLPHDLPPWQTVYHNFRLWGQDGTWAGIHDALGTELRVASGRDPQPSAAISDSQSVKTTGKGGLGAMTWAKRSTEGWGQAGLGESPGPAAASALDLGRWRLRGPVGGVGQDHRRLGP